MVVSDVSIKNQVATSIVYIHSFNQPILKILHHVVNVSNCYDSKLKGLSNELTLVLSDTRELDRVPSTK